MSLVKRRFLKNLRRTFVPVGRRIPAGHLVFVCNICGTSTSADVIHILDRELPTCPKCRSSIRFRTLVAAFQQRLFGEIKPLVQLQSRKDLQGLGMSDEELYSKVLEEKFSYTNTFFHGEPYLDIKDPSPDLRGRFDFIICAEVMEHVPPPIDIAFKNLCSLLRPRGLLIFSVPYTNESETLEHFPELHRFEILGRGEERYLVNTTQEGLKQTYHDLVFHGGEGITLEMRVFSRAGVLKMLEGSGFCDIQIHSELLPQWGIVHPHQFSLPITALSG